MFKSCCVFNFNQKDAYIWVVCTVRNTCMWCTNIVAHSTPQRQSSGAHTLCMQGAAGRGPRQLFTRDRSPKPFKAKMRGPVFDQPDPHPCARVPMHLTRLSPRFSSQNQSNKQANMPTISSNTRHSFVKMHVDIVRKAIIVSKYLPIRDRYVWNRMKEPCFVLMHVTGLWNTHNCIGFSHIE